MLILSLTIRSAVPGFETEAHWRYYPAVSVGARCDGCHSRTRAVLVPVLLDEARPDEVETDGLALCRACSSSAGKRWTAEWPVMDSKETGAVWMLVDVEEAREAANKTARERAVATTLDELQESAARALEQARANQGVNSFGKVA